MNKRRFLKLGAAGMASGLVSGMASGLAAGLLPAAAPGAEPQVRLRWLGGAMLEIEAAGLRILTDPCLGEGAEAFRMPDPNEMFDLAKGPEMRTHARLTPFPGLGHAAYDLVLLSHAHEDHFDQKAQAWLDRKLPMLCSSHDAAALAQKGFAAQALAHGAAREFEAPAGRVTVTALPAVHSLSPRISQILGLGNGYLIDVETAGARKRIYWAGDSFPAEPVTAALAGQAAPDVFIPHIGAVGGSGALGPISMSGAQAAEFAAQLAPGAVLPVHHSTYALYREGPEGLRAQHAAARPGWRLLMPAEGARIAV